MKSIVRDIYLPNGTAELTKAIVLPRRLTRHKISDSESFRSSLHRLVRRHLVDLALRTEILSAPSSGGRSGYMIFTHVATASMTCSMLNG
jgi:hypothetical protein